MQRRKVYFRDTNTAECWQVIAGAWVNLNDPDAFDDLPNDSWDYYQWDSKPENWLGDRVKNPMPYIQW